MRIGEHEWWDIEARKRVTTPPDFKQTYRPRQKPEATATQRRLAACNGLPLSMVIQLARDV